VLRPYALFGHRKHVGALLEAHYPASSTDGGKQGLVTQAGAGADVQHHLAGLKLQQRNGLQTQRHSEPRRFVVRGGVLPVAPDRQFVVAGRGHADSS